VITGSPIDAQAYFNKNDANTVIVAMLVNQTFTDEPFHLVVVC